MLSAVLAVAAVSDQADGQSLGDHAKAMYAPYGKNPNVGLLYGLIYTVAGVGVLLWLPVLRSARKGGRAGGVLATVMVLITGSLALTLLFAGEYGEQIYPSVWGVLAGLPVIAGIVAAAQLLRRRPSALR